MSDGWQEQVMHAAQRAASAAAPPQLSEDQQMVALLAWHAGANYALARLAERADELAAVWRAPGWRSYHQQVADRLSEFERCSARAGRAQYRGGPVPLW